MVRMVGCGAHLGDRYTYHTLLYCGTHYNTLHHTKLYSSRLRAAPIPQRPVPPTCNGPARPTPSGEIPLDPGSRIPAAAGIPAAGSRPLPTARSASAPLPNLAGQGEGGGRECDGLKCVSWNRTGAPGAKLTKLTTVFGCHTVGSLQLAPYFGRGRRSWAPCYGRWRRSSTPADCRANERNRTRRVAPVRGGVRSRMRSCASAGIKPEACVSLNRVSWNQIKARASAGIRRSGALA